MVSRFLLRLLLCIAGTTGAMGAAGAVEESDLLPVDEAFRLETRAPTRNRIEFHWTIAPGYYLYRERIGVQPVDSSFKFNPLELPPGKRKHDEFFGDVETYRGEVTAVLTGAAASGVDRIAFRVKSQGCADVGVCYPPQTRTVEVALPAEVEAAPPAEAEAPVGAAQLFGALQAASPAAGDAPAGTDALPLPAEQAFVFEAVATASDQVLARFTMPKGYYLYRDRTRVVSVAPSGGETGASFSAGALAWPEGVAHHDDHFGDVVVYFDQVEVPFPLVRSSTAAQSADVTFEFQGCQLDGICYPPMTRTVSVDLPAGAGATGATGTGATAARTTGAAIPAAAGAPAQSEQDRLAEALAGPNRFLTLLAFFGFGLLLCFTPCVFPMIPILSGIIAGAGENLGARRAFTLSLVYVLANAVVFTIAGIAAGLAGKNLQALFQQPWILTGFALVFVALALSMFGFYELQLPSRWQTRLADVSNRQQGGSLGGVAVMGALSALIVGPCVAPPLAAAVIYIAEKQDPVLGGMALFALGLGMGAPLIAFGMGAGQLMPRAGAWMDAVKRVFGVAFLLLAVWMLERFLAPAWIMLMLAAIFIGSGVYLGALERLPEGSSGWRTLWKALGVLLLALGVMQLIGALGGARDYLQPLQGVFGGAGHAQAEAPFKTIKSSADLDRELAAANAAGKPVLLDFYADWCVACKEMEKYTFPRPEVQRELGRYVLLKADVTPNDAVDQELLARFGLIGPPATLFFGRDGAEIKAARLIGLEKAEPFARRLAGNAG